MAAKKEEEEEDNEEKEKEEQNEKKRKRCTLYALRCKDDKFYVGRVMSLQQNAVEARFLEHCAGGAKGAEWTKKHEPIEIVETRQGDIYEEDALTLKYMDKHGVENVRGGSYVAVELNAVQRAEVVQKLRGASNQCFRCGQAGHFVAECKADDEKAKTTAKTTIQIQTKQRRRNKQYPLKKAFGSGLLLCFRCGRPGHFVSQCYARTHADGHALLLLLPQKAES
jgi:predicted GIY-YIG superfamily endonuclease